MKRIMLVVVVLVMLAGQAWGESQSAPEKTMFSCGFEQSSKSVSICQASSDPKQIFYKFGTPQKIEITLPNGKSGRPCLVHEQFGPSAFQWSEGINFPSGKSLTALLRHRAFQFNVQLTA